MILNLISFSCVGSGRRVYNRSEINDIEID